MLSRTLLLHYESNAIKNFALTLWIWWDKRVEESQAIAKFREDSYNEEALVSNFTQVNKKKWE